MGYHVTMKFSSNGAKMLHTRTISTLAAVALIAFGCQSDRTDTATNDTLLNRDITLTQQNERGVELNDVPVNSPPRVAPPSRRPSQTRPPVQQPQTSTPPKTVEPEVVPLTVPVNTAPTTGTIMEGTTALAAIDNRICTSAKPG